MKQKKVYLTLQNGKSLEGYAFGAEGEVTGELVFSTGMVGYLETLTDPANCGQIVVQTFPLIGNYGVMKSDLESPKAWVSAYVVREICDEPSNFRCEGKLEDFLKEQGVIGIYGVDTRELTKILREEGAMNAKISEKPLTKKEIATLASYSVKPCREARGVQSGVYTAKVEGAKKVLLWDFGAKKSTVANLNKQGFEVIAVSADATAEEVLARDIDGVVISDGPGNPCDYEKEVKEITKVLTKKPVLGLGLGHQLVALALGAKTAKHKYGHRGSNQPVKCVADGRVYISAQNHGYEVLGNTVRKGRISFVNVNDGSCEGIDYPEYKAMTVQFDPENCAIGNPMNPIYEQFRAMMVKE